MNLIDVLELIAVLLILLSIGVVNFIKWNALFLGAFFAALFLGSAVFYGRKTAALISLLGAVVVFVLILVWVWLHINQYTPGFR